MVSSPQSPEGMGAELMKTPERVQSTISVQDYAKTGSDRAAGRATWTAALVITAILVPWALCCRGLRSVAGGLRRPVSAVARAVLVVLGVLTLAVRRASSALTAVIRGPSVALRAIVRGSLRRCARSLAGLPRHGRFAVRWAMPVLMTVGRALGRVLARLLITARMLLQIVFSPWPLLFRPIRLAARAVALLVRGLERRVATVLRLVGRAARTIGRRLGPAVAGAKQLVSHVAVASFRSTHRLLLTVLGPVLSASAVVAAEAYRRLITMRDPIVGTISSGLTSLVRVVVAGSRRLTQLRDSWSYQIGRIGEAFTRMSRRTADGARVAAGTARHHANRLAVSASSADWRLTACADRGPSVASEDERKASFTLDLHHNEYLRPGESTISAVISVGAEMHLESTSRPEMVEVILLDCSASMAHPWDKILYARRATQAAVSAVPDGVWFSVVRGAESAEVAYPRRGGVVRASDRTRGEAFRAIAGLQPVGGTAIGRWLSMARELVALRPGALGHALLMTDGKDEDESPIELRTALEECEGLFQCDCRGVGTDWAVEELRHVSTALLGTVDIIKEPAGMEADFRSVIERAMSRGIEASMRIRTPVHAKVTAFRQVSPTVVDLTPRARRIDAQTIQLGLGGWTRERREYHLSVDVEPGPVGSEMAACRLAIVVANRIHSSELVRAIWTVDPELSARIDLHVAHYSGQAELAAAIQEGLQARREGNLDRAILRLGRAVQISLSSGRTDLLSLLTKVVDVVDGEAGTVALGRKVEDYDEMALDTRSTRTARPDEHHWHLL